MMRWQHWAAVGLALVAGRDCVVAHPTPSAPPMVAQIVLDGPIGPAAAEYVDHAMQRATRDGAEAIVLRMDTPGGLSDSMRQVVSGMLACKVPVLVFVAPAGARAASAGTYILYAGQVAAMAPATHVGAATPVQLGGRTPLTPRQREAPGSARSAASAPPSEAQDAESVKVLNDSIAYLRALAQLRGRNADWAEQAVRGAATLTATEAARQHVIDFVADDVHDLLAKADGRQVRVGERLATLRLRGATVRDYPPDARTRFLAVVTNPTVAYLLLLAGIYGLVLEALHPGVLFPGVVGGICLLTGLYALQLLPVNYAGLALMALGLGLLIAEALTPTVGALGVGGLAAFVVGSVMLMDRAVPGYGIDLGVIAGLATVAAALLAWIPWQVLNSRRQPDDAASSMVTDRAVLLEPVDASGQAWAMVRGERWQVRCPIALPAGSTVRVVRREGLLLWVEPA